MTATASPRLRLAARAAGALVALALAGLAWLWASDLQLPFEAPRWERSSFVVLRDRGEGEARETWVVAFHPLCGHCRASLARVREAAAAIAPPPRVALLLVDAPAALAQRTARGLDVAQIFWDERDVWRRRWGHRLYGEVLRFGRDGRYQGPVQLGAAPPR